MSKKIKLWLLAGIILSLSGVLLFFISFAAGGKNYLEKADLNRLSGTAKWEDKKPDLILEKTKLEKFQSIQADLEDIDFIIKPSEDENYYISYELKSRNGNVPMNYDIEDGILNLKEDKKATSFHLINIDIGFFTDNFQKGIAEDYQEKVTVYVPEQENLKNCRIVIHDGCVTIKKFHCDNTKMELGYGDLLLENASFSKSSIILKDGDLKAEEADFYNTEITMSYGSFSGRNSSISDGQMVLKDGDMEIEKTNIKDADLKLSYGDLKAKNLIIENSSILLKDGTLESYYVNFLNKNRIEDSYGDIIIQMEKELFENTALKLETKYGNIEVEHGLSGSKEKEGNRQYYEKITDGADHELEITAEDGDIFIK